MANVDWEWLRPWTDTDKQRAMLDTVASSRTVKDAADRLGVEERNIYLMVKRLKKKAADSGVSPENGLLKPLPSGQRLKGVSELQTGEGDTLLRWVKSEKEKDDLRQEIDEAIAAFSESVKPAKAVKKNKGKVNEDLANVHILTDYHLGMLAWQEEAGESWDIKIAEQLITDWFTYALAHAPDAHTGVLAQLGDYIHFDGFEPVTVASGHLLDADTRFQKIVRVAIRSLRRIIHAMLKRYEHVHIIMADANHDPASAAWLREMFAAFYADEPRITVDNSADTYYCLEHGKTSLFFHHGHKRKPGNIDDVLAAKFREIFGRTKYSYCHMGHMHHIDVKETNLMVVEQHRTMAAKDAYASRGGWMAGRGAPVITYSKEYGEVGRLVITPEML